MRETEDRVPSGLVVLNFSGPGPALPPAASVPTLVRPAVMSSLSEGDPEPYYKVEAVEYPAPGKGGTYEKSFFKSFLNIMKDRPIPGSKRGHEFSSRSSSDFYTVGGDLVDNADGKTGTAYFKIYIPQKGDTTENFGFIRDAKAGIVHFSLVSAPEYVTKKDPKTGEEVRHFLSSKGFERNDAMEYGTGAMQQVVNSQSDSIDFKVARELVTSGRFDRSTKVSGAPVQGGIVYRSALRSMISRANGQDLPEVAELISLIDKHRNGGSSMETKEEALGVLSNLMANGRLNVAEVAKACGFEAQVRTPADAANADLVRAINSKLGDKPIERIDALMSNSEAFAAATVERAVSAAVGQKVVKNAEGKDVDNPAHAYAMSACRGKSGAELNSAIEALKADPVMVALNAARADGESGINKVVNGGKSVASSGGAIAPLNV